MCISKSFSKGFELFKKNFWTLISLCFSRLAFAMIIGILGVVLLAPLMSSGISQIISNPGLVFESSSALQYGAYFVFYIFLLVGIVALAMPALAYPHLAGAVLATKKKKFSFQNGLELLKKHYVILLVDGFIYSLLTLYLFIQSALLFLSYPLSGLLMFLASIYLTIRLAFWDILALKGEEHPLKASWKLTKKSFWAALGFIVLSNLLIEVTSLVPLVGLLFGILTIPFVSTSKAVFVSELSGKKRSR